MVKWGVRWARMELLSPREMSNELILQNRRSDQETVVEVSLFSVVCRGVRNRVVFSLASLLGSTPQNTRSTWGK